MPLIVDHEARRREVTEIAYGLIARGGMDAATVRKVADETGYSTNIVSHYFAGKRDLLQATFDLSLARSKERFFREIETGNLDQALEALLPIDEAQRQNWRIWFAFWAAAVSYQGFADQQARQVRNIRLILKNFFLESGFFPSTLPDEEVENLARTTVSIVVGLATQASFDPDDWPPEQQRAVIRNHINYLKGIVGASSTML